MARIKHVLNERRRAYEAACNIRQSPNAASETLFEAEEAEAPAASEVPEEPKVETAERILDRLRHERIGRHRSRVVRPNAIAVARANSFRKAQQVEQPSSSDNVQEGGGSALAEQPAAVPDLDVAQQSASKSSKK